MTDLAAIIESNSLEFHAVPVESNPVMPQETDDLTHWFCTLSGGVISGFDFYVSLAADYDGAPPEAEFALSLLLMDVRAYRECAGYDDFAKMLGIEDDDPQGQAQGYAAFEELSKISPLMEEVLDLGDVAPASSM